MKVSADKFKKIKTEVENGLRPYSSKVSHDVLRALKDPISFTGKDNSSGCTCHGYNCGCCAHVELDKIHLNDTVCANFSLPAPEYGISVTLTVDDKTIISETVSADEFKKIKTEVENGLRPYSSKVSHDVLRALKDPISFTRKDNSSGCACHGYNCGCCVHVKWDKIKLDDTVCANFSYLPAPEYGISVTLTVDDKTIINETVSAKNPPPVCVAVPHLKKYASLCVKFKDLSISNHSFSGCVFIEAELLKIKIEELKIGCFKIPPGNEIGTSDVNTYLHQIGRAKAVGVKRVGYWNSHHDSSKMYFKSLKNSPNKQI
ncbi:uncharacterized protein LOC123537927 isoform X2 [Mercenaria mercenaria]|uniref:uncharacterized protein LOC123537927 isoform X2 n=1 Tax=Mercenaria mercenaria TaxID=6596 RepID=UPI00234E496D|nr:uncharacterized protein LOC123537927 isoform X2 [Mercenaria mercenaria]